MYLAHHELESEFIVIDITMTIIIIIVITITAIVFIVTIIITLMQVVGCCQSEPRKFVQ